MENETKKKTPGFIKKLPLETAIKPRNGEAIINRWWVVDDEGLYWFSMTEKARYGWRPQCNHHENIAKSIQEKLYPDARIEFIEVVYAGHHDEEYGYQPFKN